MNWRALEARVDNTLASAFGETVRLSFMKNGRIDPDRPAVDIRALLHVGGDDSVGVGEGFRTRIAAGQAELFIDCSTYAGPTPRKGDKLRATDRAGSPFFEVALVSDRDSNLLTLSLTAA